MELRVLRYFLAVAETGSITRAAERLHLAQPSLSRQLKEFEQRLGTTLFERGSRHITLTDTGELLRARATEIVSLADRTEQELLSAGQAIGGPVFIGAGESDAFRTVAQAARATRAIHPDVTFQIHSGNGRETLEQLESGLIDFALLYGPRDLAYYTSFPLPVADTWGLLMRKNDPLARRQGISAEDLRSMPLLVSVETAFDQEFGAWGDIGPHNLRIAGTYNLVNNAALCVSEGVGCALTLDRIVNTEGTDLTFRPLTPRLEARLSVYWNPRRRFTRAASAFLEQLRMLTDA